MKLRYGTRGSPLALAQAKWVAKLLESFHPGLETEPVVIETSGDRFARQESVASPASGAENVKAMFVKEIEEALLRGEVEFAVHSAKDLPGQLPEGLVLAAIPKREDPRDVYVGGSTASWLDLKRGDKVGTGSLRRRLQLRLAAPLVEYVEMRGNIDTRLRKLAAGQAAGIILARAGLRRLGLAKLNPHEAFSVETMVPAPGQGALAVQCRADRRDVLDALKAVDDPGTRLEVDCERAFLRLMGGGCRTPLGAFAKSALGRLEFHWFWARENGVDPQRGKTECEASLGKFLPIAEDIARRFGR